MTSVSTWTPWQKWSLRTGVTALKVGAAAAIADMSVNAATKTLGDVQIGHTASVTALAMVISVLYSLSTLSIKGITDQAPPQPAPPPETVNPEGSEHHE